MAEMTQEEKEKELYKASLPAFFMNEVETDKIILTLSVGAIGFYSALLTGKDIILTEIMFIFMVISTLLYGVTVAMVLGVFAQNKKQLLSIISTNGIGEENPHLSFLDKHKYKPFIFAVFFSILFMLALIYKHVNSEVKEEPSQNSEINLKEEPLNSKLDKVKETIIDSNISQEDLNSSLVDNNLTKGITNVKSK